MAGRCKYGNEYSSSRIDGEYFDLLSDFSFSRNTLFHGVSELVSLLVS